MSFSVKLHLTLLASYSPEDPSTVVLLHMANDSPGPELGDT